MVAGLLVGQLVLASQAPECRQSERGTLEEMPEFQLVLNTTLHHNQVLLQDTRRAELAVVEAVLEVAVLEVVVLEVLEVVVLEVATRQRMHLEAMPHKYSSYTRMRDRSIDRVECCTNSLLRLGNSEQPNRAVGDRR